MCDFVFVSPKASSKRKPPGKTAAQVADERARFEASVEAQKAAIDAEAEEMMKALEAGVDENFDGWDPVRACRLLVICFESSCPSMVATFAPAIAHLVECRQLCAATCDLKTAHCASFRAGSGWWSWSSIGNRVECTG